jgi:hypothetical protein
MYTLLFFACGEPESDGDPLVDTDTADSDTDTDTDVDTEVDTDTDARPEPPAVGGTNWEGQAHVVLDTSWIGSETRTVVGTEGEVLCIQTYALTGSPWGGASNDCPECTFRFRTVASDLNEEDGEWCAELGATRDEWYPYSGLGYDASDGWIAWYSGIYEWSAAEGTTAVWTGDDVEGDLLWNWNWTERFFYSFE